MNTALHNLILARIQAKGRLTFAEFMQLALYEPGLGYYTRQPNLIGARGDFYTAPHLTPVFGELLARHLTELWERLGQPANMQLIEMGAGQGTLAGDILVWIKRNRPALWEQLAYIIIELSDFLSKSQRLRLQAVAELQHIPDLLDKTSWRELNSIGDGTITGVFFSNELVDAFPVHLVQVEQQQLGEIYITADAQGQFVEVSGPLSTPALHEYFVRLGLDLTHTPYTEGYRTEVNLAALAWLADITAKLKTGYVLTIDYGYTAASRYNPRRSSGTLQTYFQHRVKSNPYIHIGEQDITTHVDFSALIQVGEQYGLRNEGFTNQAAFLAELGIADKLMELNAPAYAEKSGQSISALLREREALLKLISPTEMGNFGVLLQSKGVQAADVPLSGFSLKL